MPVLAVLTASVFGRELFSSGPQMQQSYMSIKNSTLTQDIPDECSNASFGDPNTAALLAGEQQQHVFQNVEISTANSNQ